ncbi:MAG: hypothetical protein R3C52_00665 [Hyphomonadaceae bacterium]
MEQTIDPMMETGVSTTDVSGAAGSFLGIPYGWPLAVAVVLAIVVLLGLLWALRGSIHNMGVWLLGRGNGLRNTADERIAAFRAEEYQDRMIVLANRVRTQAEKLPSETGPIIAKLDKSATTLSLSAEKISEINVDELAERKLRVALDGIEEGRGASKVERNTTSALARAMKEQLSSVRPQLIALKAEAPRVQQNAERLSKVCTNFNANADRVTDTFRQFEEAVSPDQKTRLEAASRQSILMPWVIALFITMIALSGVFLNFFLIQRPMAEIVGEGSRIAGIGLPTFAAMIVIFLEFVAGVVLMDAAGFTKLIPTFGGMSDGSRKIMFWVAFAFLAAFSFLEASLAIVREQIMENDMATSRLAADLFLQPSVDAAGVAAAGADAAAAGSAVPADAAVETAEPGNGVNLITMAQIILAVLIPWMLATAALPLETIVRNSVFLWHIFWANVLIVMGSVFKAIGETMEHGFRSIHASPERDFEDRKAARAAADEVRREEKESRADSRRSAKEERKAQKAERELEMARPIP